MRPKEIPNHLEWVYIYESKTNGEIVYVGRAKNSHRCSQRIAEHTKDGWHSEDHWILHFCPCANRAESEGLETELINRHQPSANKDKRNWGLFLDNIPLINEMISIDESSILSNYALLRTNLERCEYEIIQTIKRRWGNDNREQLLH